MKAIIKLFCTILLITPFCGYSCRIDSVNIKGVLIRIDSTEFGHWGTKYYFIKTDKNNIDTFLYAMSGNKIHFRKQYQHDTLYEVRISKSMAEVLEKDTMSILRDPYFKRNVLRYKFQG